MVWVNSYPTFLCLLSQNDKDQIFASIHQCHSTDLKESAAKKHQHILGKIFNISILQGFLECLFFFSCWHTVPYSIESYLLYLIVTGIKIITYFSSGICFLEALMLYESHCSKNPRGGLCIFTLQYAYCTIQSHLPFWAP